MSDQEQIKATKNRLVTNMLDAFGFKANDAQLATYIEIAYGHDLEDVATCTAAFRRGEVREHTNKAFPPSPAMFGEAVVRFKKERLQKMRPVKAIAPVKEEIKRPTPERVQEALRQIRSMADQSENKFKRCLPDVERLTPEQSLDQAKEEFSKLFAGGYQPSEALLKTPIMQRALNEKG